MKTAVIEGGDLKHGNFQVSGYKHASNILICASLAIESCSIIQNVPDNIDTRILLKIINGLGGSIIFKDQSVEVKNSLLSSQNITSKLSSASHAPLYLIPVLLGRYGYVNIGITGGCQIGDESGKRPTHHMLKVLESFGSSFKIRNNRIVGKTKGFNSCVIDILDYSSSKNSLTGPLVSGATKTAMLAALLTKDNGQTIIKNPYRKPDVLELIRFMRSSGFVIKDDKKKFVISRNTSPKKVVHFLVPDISTIFTFIACGIYNNSTLSINNIDVKKVKEGLKTELDCFKKMNVSIIWKKNSLFIPLQSNIRGIDIKVTCTSIYSDHQPFFALILTKAQGKSSITEFVWKSRFSYAHELQKLATTKIFSIKENTLYINPGKLSRQNIVLNATDLRAAAVLVIATLSIKGESSVKNTFHLDRGYENFFGEIRKLGAKVKHN